MDIPSLFMIPSAVSSGKVHSVFPNSTDADFDFNRDSDATRVNSEGLIERVGYYGSELITNGDFSTNSDWALANSVIENGVLKLNGQSGTVRARQNISFTGVAKITYTISFNNTSNTTMQLRDFSGANNVTIPATVGVHTVFRNFATTGITLQTPPVVGAEIHLDNVSVKEVTGDRARLNYEIEGGLVNTKPSLLLEPQSTNLITYSQDISNSYWLNSNSTSISNTAIAPDGTLTADELVDNTSNGYHWIYKPGVQSNARISFFAKANQLSQVWANGGGGSNFAGFDLLNGTITKQGGTSNPKIEEYKNGWYRCSLTSDNSGVLIATMVDNDETYIGSGKSIYLWGIQAEALTYATSYIPTNGSTQTRAAETCNGAGTSSIFESSEGILYAEVQAFSETGSSGVFTLSGGSNTNRVKIELDGGVVKGRVDVSGSGVGLLNYTVAITNYLKIALKWKASDFELWVNGSSRASITSGSSFSANALTELAFDRGDGGEDFYGKIRDIRVYNTKEMTDSEVDILLTKITS